MSEPTKAPALSAMLVSMPQREVGGSIAADRFDYQKDWTLCKLLQLHQEGHDYVVLCEYHEDVTVLDNSEDPKSAIFYQIKTDDSKNWTLRRLLHRKKTRDKTAQLPSIMGKLCGKATALPLAAATYRFVSNAECKLRLDPTHVGPSPRILLGSMLHPDDLAELAAALNVEIGVDFTEILKNAVAFEIAELPLNEHAKTATGALADFLDKYAKGCTVAISPFYRTLFDEIRRRTSAEQSASMVDICKKKGISRADLDSMLNAAIRTTPTDRTWLSIESILTAELVHWIDQRSLSQAYREYFIRSLSPVDLGLQKGRRLLIDAAHRLLAQKPAIGLHALAVATVEEIRGTGVLVASQLSDSQAQVLVMVEIYEGRDREVPQADTQSAQGQL